MLFVPKHLLYWLQQISIHEVNIRFLVEIFIKDYQISNAMDDDTSSNHNRKDITCMYVAVTSQFFMTNAYQRTRSNQGQLRRSLQTSQPWQHLQTPAFISGADVCFGRPCRRFFHFCLRVCTSPKFIVLFFYCSWNAVQLHDLKPITAMHRYYFSR